MLALEIMDTEYLHSIQKFVKIRDHIKSPWLQVYPDVGNLTAWGHDVSAELALGAEDIVGVHLKDIKKGAQQFPRSIPRRAIWQRGCKFCGLFPRAGNSGLCRSIFNGDVGKAERR